MLQTEELLAGRYRLGRLLGSGGFGSVYLATDERLHRPVAIKMCSTRGLPALEAAEAARLFQSEALTLARLRHPGLTAIWDYFNQDDKWYLVMEYVPGDTLRTLLRRAGGPLPYGDALSYARQLCAVLGYLHRQTPPVVFRDLKPANIMVTPEGQLKLIDFGIARLFSPGKLADTAQFGTPGYAPPEQYGGQTEPRSDIFSMGVVLHEMLTHHNPASTPFVFPAVRSLNPAVPAPIDELVARATAYDVDRRVASVEDFCSLMDLSVERPPAAPTVQRPAAPREQRLWSPPPRALPSPPPSSGFGRSLIMIVLLLVLLGSLAAGAFLLRDQLATLRDDLSIVAPIGPLVQVPAATAIFSAATAEGSEYLYRVDIANGKTETLLELPQGAGALQPAISPDGQQIAYTREQRAATTANQVAGYGPVEVWIMNADGSENRPVLPGYSSRSPAWSPDGRFLALEIANDLWLNHDIAIIDLETNALTTIAASKRWEGGPAWSPDGRRLAYQGRVAGGKCMQLFVADINTGSTAQVTDLPDEGCTSANDGAVWPDWSPDGSRLAFERNYQGVEQLALLDLVTRAVSILDTGERQAGYPRWSPKGSAILFEQGKGAETRLARLNLETCAPGCEVEVVETALPGSHLADWQ